MKEASGRRRTVRISDVAAAAGVSKTLVSYALNNRPGVREETRARIVATAREMGWTPSLPARALSVSRAYAVGLVFEKSPEALASDQYYTSLMAGLQSVLSTSQYSLVTEVVESPEAERDAYLRLAHDGRVDGMVIVDLRQDDPRFALVREAGLAFVSLGWPPQRTTMPVLVYDESQAITDVVQHLVDLGHRRVAQVVGPQASAPARLRRELYQKRFKAHGIDASAWIESDYTAAGGRAATAALLDADPRPTAIVYSNDLMAVAGMSAAFSRGLRVPGDISIVGWDDITISQYLHPALSTVTQHPFEDGKAAAELLLEAIGGREFVEPVWMPNPRFVPRESSGSASA
ncbi:LacI family transcriptional regulator [Asanoa ferruginea]|uniref:LacI family transcriptional regulator n=1 Tax=Asanoa ferruginea TaxID=53367 RepID=A0A3D9ZSG2_9ACTN|nr:LacI family DNA-binding transcriptional regulator [Asanoa ferruginea]REG00146.1 LacI family transcriptional regulator [Asanoa ferruginea]GIF46156.1 LacI family transcriptional regulator [Asanoa ferruginea]